MKLKLVKLCQNPSTETVYQKDIKVLQDVPRNLVPDFDTVMAIDPGTNSLGFSLGRYEDKIPIFTGVLKRDKSHPNESDTNQYSVKLVEILVDLIKLLRVKELIIEDQFLIPKFKDSYRKLTTLKDTILGRCGLLDIKTYQVKPQEWKSVVLAEYKNIYNINMSESNKEWIQRKMRKDYISAMNITELDASDSYGILLFYYDRYKIDDDKPFQILSGLEKDYKHNIKKFINKVNNKNYEEIFNIAELLRKSNNRDRIQMVVFDKSLSLEDNIRSMTTKSNNIFITVTNPYAGIMQELMKNRNSIGELENDSEVYIIFYRENAK